MITKTSGVTAIPELGAPQSAKAVLLSKKGASTSIIESLGSLGMYMFFAAVATVAIGAGITFGQNTAATSLLDSVKSAQVLMLAKTGTYADQTALTTGTDPAMTAGSGNWKIATDGDNYCAVVKSDSVFHPVSWITAKGGKVVDSMPSAAEAGIACPTLP